MTKYFSVNWKYDLKFQNFSHFSFTSAQTHGEIKLKIWTEERNKNVFQCFYLCLYFDGQQLFQFLFGVCDVEGINVPPQKKYT